MKSSGKSTLSVKVISSVTKEFKGFKYPQWMQQGKSIRDSTAQTIYAISTHLKNSNELPGAVQLASYSWLKITPKAAASRIRRLRKNEYIIYDKIRRIWVLHPLLIHKKNSAKILLLVYEECTKPKSMRVRLDRIYSIADSLGIDDVEEIIIKSHVAGYIAINKVDNDEYITIRDPLRCLLRYLRIINNGPAERG